MSTVNWARTNLLKKKVESVRVCLVTPGHLSTNPRLVKEADAMFEAGYQVHVIASRFIPWADQADREFADRAWQVSKIPFGPAANFFTRSIQWLSKRVGLLIYKYTGFCAERAFHPAYPALQRAACKVPAEMYVAHNLAALPAAWRAAQKHGALLGFDAEDFHSGELLECPENSALIQLTRSLEQKYLPLCDYVSAASEGIAAAYSQAYSIKMPLVINNVFPKVDAPSGRVKYPTSLSPSLYWFSQTIGPGRGLELVVSSIALSASRPVLYLRGNSSSRYRSELDQLAASMGVGANVEFLAPESPGAMLKLAASYDIGLATEVSLVHNRDICITNKIFTYLQSGIPVIATNTTGQLEIALQAPGAIFVFSRDNPQELANIIDDLLLSPGKLEDARQAAWEVGDTRFNWDQEKLLFLDNVKTVIAAASK